MYIQFSNSGIPSWATKHTPTQLYYRNSQGELTAFNGSEIEHNEYIDTLVRGLEKTLSSERDATMENLLKSKDEVLSKIPQYVKINRMITERYKLRVKKENSFFTSRIDRKIDALNMEAQLLASEVISDHYLSTGSTVYDAQSSIQRFVRESIISVLKDTPTSHQIKSLLITIPDIKSKTFDELLSLTRTTFA
jgi:hypothetical protein